MNHKVRGRKGFTLAELLIVVGIMAILSAVSFPAVIRMRNSLRQTELDEKARQIFITAQNCLSGLRLSGVVLEVPPNGTDGNELEKIPSDYETGERPDTYALCDGEAGSFAWMNDTAFSPTLVREDGGSYVIEFNRRTNTVYGVYYWEKEGSAFQKDSLFSYQDNFNEYDGKPLRGDENRKNRMIPSVGYYGGETSDAANERRDVEFQVSIDNGERLEAMISLPSSLYGNAVFEVTVSSKTDSGGSARYRYRLQNGNIAVIEPEDSFHKAAEIWQTMKADQNDAYVLTLDSLEEGLHFADHFSGITAGDDLQISVMGYCVGSDAVYVPKTKTAEINSLFAGLRGGKGIDGEVQVENGRHLQNLSYEISGLGYKMVGDKEQKTSFPVTSARLVNDIDWMEPVYDGLPYDEACTARRDSGLSGKVCFYPISNEKTDLSSFYGNGCVIKGIHVMHAVAVMEGEKTALYGAGLFGYMEGLSSRGGIIKDVMMVNPYLELGNVTDSHSADSYAGSLAGFIDGMEIENCGAYIDSDDEKADFPALYDENGIDDGCDYGGGLIGGARNLKAGNSFAAVRVSAKRAAGGWIGTVSGKTAISTCYSGGHTVKGAYRADQPNVTAADMAGGFAGEFDGSGRIEKSFSACSVSASECGPLVGSLASGEKAVTFDTTYAVGNAFVQDGGHDPNDFGCGSTGDALANGARKAERENTAPYDDTYWGPNGVSAAYPYPIWLNLYRGDWAGSTFTGLVYYERYQTEKEEEEFGFWYPEADGNGTLRDDLPVISDGYGYLSDTVRTVKLFQNGKPNEHGNAGEKEDQNWNKNVLTLSPMQIEGGRQVLYAVPWIVTDKEFDSFKGPKNKKQHSFYDTLALTVDGAALTAYYNPHFAKAIVFTEEEAETSPDNAVIRTARHLYELGYKGGKGKKSNTDYWDAPWDYSQERDIDCEIYDPVMTYPDAENVPKTLLQGMIGSSKEAVFQKSYAGNGHTISHLILTDESVDSKNVWWLALFGYTGEQSELSNLVFYRPQVITKDLFSAAGLVYTNGGSVKGIKLISPTIYGVDSNGCRAAGLVYENISGASIEGCYLIPEQEEGGEAADAEDLLRFKHLYGADGKVTRNNYTNAVVAASGSASGLVGENYGSVKNCAVVASVTASGTAAGFVSVNKETGRIENCYANCYTAGKEAAGFVYDANRPSVIIGCYSLRRVTATSSSGTAAGFSIKDEEGTIFNCYAAVSNGYSSGYQVAEGLILYPDCQYANMDGHGASFLPFSASRQTNCCYMDWTENSGEDGGSGKEAAHEALAESELEKPAPIAYVDLKKKTIPGLVSADPGGADTVTFSRMLPGVYPFPKAEGLIQYGDWPNYEYVGAELAYFEIYKEESGYTVGFYNEELGLDSLRDGKKIFLDGYGLLFNTEYLEMDGVNVKNLIQGSSSSNDKAYLSWEDRNGSDNTTTSATNYLKSVYNLRDNDGKAIEKGVSYYKTSDSEAAAIRKGTEAGYPDQPLELKLNNRTSTYYFRILPPAAVVTNAYVPSGTVYQQIAIHVESNYYDEMGGISAGIIQKNREFYYCPHFAKSKISTEGKPEEMQEPEYLSIRTPRQLLTLCGGNQVSGSDGIGLDNYYGKAFKQEQDIGLGEENPYAFYYSDTAPFSEERGRCGYRWFNSSIGTGRTPFSGTYDGGGCTISGLGAWDTRGGISGLKDFEKVTANKDVPLFGFLKGANVKNVILEGAAMSQQSDDLRGILCREASNGTVIDHVTIEKAKLDLRNFAAGKEGFGLLAGTLSGSAIKNCAVNSSAVECGDGAVKYIGGAVGRLKAGGTVEDLTLSDVSVGGGRATHLGGAVGFAENGQVRRVSLNGSSAAEYVNAEGSVMEGDRGVGGVIGQIHSGTGAVTVEDITMAGTITVRQTAASNSSKLYNGAGLVAGLCEISGNPVTVSNVSAQGTGGSILVENTASSQYHIGGLLVGSLYRSSGDALSCALTLGNMEIHGARLLSDGPGKDSVYCGYGGLIGQNSKAAVLAGGDHWNLEDSRISVDTGAGAKRYHSDSGVAGLIGKFLEAGDMTLPARVTLPDIAVRVQANGSIPVSGAANGTSGKMMTIRAAAANSEVGIGSIVTENCRNTGGLTAVLSDSTVLSGISAGGIAGEGGQRQGLIQASGNAGGIAGTITCGPSNIVKNLSVNGVKITGAGNVGGFAGVITGGVIEQCFACADVSVVWPVDSAAGGFIGKIENGTISRCYASGNVSAAGGEGGKALLRAGGFFGDITSAGRLSSCYASGNAAMRYDNAAAGSALGGFGGSISAARGSQVAVSQCYSVGAVRTEPAEAGETADRSAVEAGGFIGHLVKTKEVFAVSDDMIQNLIRMMKGAEVHNRNADQNGRTVWDLSVGMDSETRGIFDSSNISALVYNLLGYPEYPDMLKKGIESTNRKAPDEAIRNAYGIVFDGADQLLLVSSSAYDESYYHTFFEKSRENSVMTVWSIAKNGNTRYLYWINESSPAAGKTYTGYRISLEAYDLALREAHDNTDRRRKLFETKQVRLSMKTDGSYDNKQYLYLTDLGGTWQAVDQAAVADCYFLRDDGSLVGRYNADYGPVENYIEPWSVEQFSQEMTNEKRNVPNAVLTDMEPAPENTGPGYSSYPFPMLEGVGAGAAGRTHTGLWPSEYHPYYRLTD